MDARLSKKKWYDMSDWYIWPRFKLVNVSISHVVQGWGAYAAAAVGGSCHWIYEDYRFVLVKSLDINKISNYFHDSLVSNLTELYSFA